VKSMADRKLALEPETVGGQTEMIGRDPRNMTQAELEAVGHRALSPTQAIRARCLDCCAGQASEVRRCVSVSCSSWPWRMGTNPWREKRELSPERRAALVEVLAKARARRATP
jgi:hypothetical protein